MTTARATPYSTPALITTALNHNGDGGGTVWVAMSSAVSAPSPTLAITSNVSALKAGETATIRFTFSDQPLGFTLGDVAVVNGTLSNFAATDSLLVYTATFTPLAGMQNGTASVSVGNGSYTDLAGNSGTAGVTPAITLHTAVPTTTVSSLVFSGDSGLPDRVTNVASQTLSGALSASPAPGESVQVSLNHGVTWQTATLTGGNNWSLPGQVLQSGTGQQVQVRVSDASGNPGSTAAFDYRLDQTSPSVRITSSKTGLNSADTPLITFTFSEEPVGFGTGGIQVGGGLLSGLSATTNPLVYTAVFTPTAGQASGTGTIAVTPGGYADLAGNSGLGAASLAIPYNTVSPGVAILSDASTLKAGEVAHITFRFSTAPIDFTFGDITVGGGTLSNLSATSDALIFTALFTPNPTAQGTGTISIGNGLFIDINGNPGLGGSVVPITVDMQAPGVTITSSAATLKAGDSATITITFTEQPHGFTAANLVGSGLVVSGLAATADPTVYTATIKPQTNYSGTGTVSIAASSYADVAGNLGAGSGVVTVASVDTIAPTLAIQSSSAFLKAGETALITFTFSEAPADFTAQDIALNNSALGTLGTLTATADARVFTALFTPSAGVAAGMVTISVAAGSYQDTAGNLGPASSLVSFGLDTLGPAAAPTGRPHFTNDTGSSLTDLITAVASQVVSGSLTQALGYGDRVQVSFDNGAVWDTATTVNDTWSIDHTLTSSSNVKVRVIDSSGNASAEIATPYQFDQTRPTVTITGNVPFANGVTPAVITFRFSEEVVGFNSGSLFVGGGTLGGLTPTADPKVYTANFTAVQGVASGSATITVSGGYTDIAGNNGAAGAIPSLLIDTVAPVAGVSSGMVFSADSGIGGDLTTNVAVQTITGRLFAPLAGGDAVQISLDNGANWLPASVSGLTWSTTRTLSGSSTLVARVVDAAGNFSTPVSATYTIDTTPPTVTIASSIAGTVGYGQATTLTFTLSDPGVLTLADIAVTGGVLSDFSGSGTSYTAKLTPPADSAVPITVTVAGGLFTDVAGNTNVAATPLVLAVDTSPPPDSGGNTTPPATATVDGVPVTTAPGPNGATVTTIPVVSPTRSDTPGSTTPLADIPLARGPDGHPIVSVSVPTGVGLTAEGLGSGVAGSAALAELGLRIERIAGSSTELINAGNVFYATLAPNESLHVQIIKPSIGAGYDGSQPLVIHGSTNPADGKQAIIIDARALPSGTVIQVDNIEFIAVVGDVRLVGGAGQNMASGDGGAQWIVLGPGDDIIHGGAGNDVVGSEAGDDQVYGDAGDDIVFGGAGNDILSGGAGSDRLNGGTGFDVALQEGKRTDYTVTLDGPGIKLTHTASGVSDWLVDVEQVRFKTGPILTVAHSAAEEATAYLFQKWLGRDLNQSEGAAIQTLAGQSAEQVATLFAQLFPTQAAGRTPAQLLEGMAAAGTIRVDAVRDVIVNGDAGKNTITPTLGLARYVDGGAGIDTVVIPATLGQTFVQHNASGSYTLQRLTDGAMLDVSNVERVQFNDTKLALDLNGHAGEAARLLGTLAGPATLANKGVVGEVIRLLDAGASSQTIAGLGLQLLGASTPTQIAQTLWTNVTGRAGTSDELKLLTDIMATGVSAADLVVIAAHLDATAARIDLVGLAAKGLEFA